MRRRVSLTGQFASIDDDLTGAENLVVLARLLGYSRRQARHAGRPNCLRRSTWPRRPAGRSRRTPAGCGGVSMSRRALSSPRICCFSTSPRPGSTRAAVTRCGTSCARSSPTVTTILLTTQYLDEADQLADRIAVVDHGKIIAEGTPGELKASVGSNVLHVRLAGPQHRPQAERLLAETLACRCTPAPTRPRCRRGSAMSSAPPPRSPN